MKTDRQIPVQYNSIFEINGKKVRAEVVFAPEIARQTDNFGYFARQN